MALFDDLEKDVARGRRAGYEPVQRDPVQGHTPRCSVVPAPLQCVQHEAPMQTGCFVRRQRRAEARFHLAGDGGFREDHQSSVRSEG